MRKNLLTRITVLVLLLNAAAYGGELRTGLASNANFTILADNQELAESVAKKADKLRLAIAKEWLGESIPNGFGPTSINVFFSNKDTARTWLLEEHSKRTNHMTWIYTSREKLDSTLAHEVAHTVLWCRYSDLPTFAHEAIASSYDGEKRKKIRLSTLKWFARTNRWPKLKQLFRAESIEPSNHSSYTAAVSIKEFLLSRNSDKSNFLKFANSAAKDEKWDSALQKYYEIPSVNDLQNQWQAWVRKNTAGERLK